MNGLWANIPQGRVEIIEEDLVRISKEKVKFAKWCEQTISTGIFRIFKVIQRVP